MCSNSDNKSNHLNKKTESFPDINFDVDSIQKLSPDEIILLLQELQIHQLDLEMQNEELRNAQRELLEVRNQFADLYDFAPVGYIVFNAFQGV